MSAAVRPLTAADGPWVRAWTAADFGDETAVSRGKLYHPDQLSGFVAEQSGQPVGLLTYRLDGDECEVVSLHSHARRQGVGTLLIRAVVEFARQAGLRRVWLITTNDNTPAQRFYESGHFRLAAVHKGALAESRRLKPAIPLTGIDGVPIEDELEYEFILR